MTTKRSRVGQVELSSVWVRERDVLIGGAMLAQCVVKSGNCTITRVGEMVTVSSHCEINCRS